MRQLFIFLCLLISCPIQPQAGNCLTHQANELHLLPKAELHLHLGGAYPLPYLLSIATPEQADQLNLTLDLIRNRTSYHDIFSCFHIVSQIVNTEDKVRLGVEALCKALQADHVTYAEIRTGLKNLSDGYEEYLKAVLMGVHSQSSSQFQAKILLSLQRNSTSEMAKTTIDLALKYRDQGVIGIDLSGNSLLGESREIMSELIRAKKEGLALVIHMGESPNETDQLDLLQRLHPDRIGHAVYLYPEAERWIIEHQVPIEICLTSSVLVGLIEKYTDHPGFRYYAQGHPVAFCTDDPLLFSTFLTQEFLIAHTQGGLSIDELKEIARNTFQHSIK